MSLREQVPNKALTGREVLECAVQDFRAMLERDCMFQRGVAYRRVAYSFSVTFHLGYPAGDYTVKSHTKASGIVEGEVPLEDPGADAIIVALERDVTIENPNLARVHHDLPVKIVTRGEPKPIPVDALSGDIPQGVLDPFPQMITHELRYDKKDYPPLPAPVDRDVSQEVAKKLGVRIYSSRKPRGISCEDDEGA